ncbi:MAG: hypothetical protein FVQ85_10790 [Planctomycetes bacterium]|nr:hypothetical protein [Planctomycetota bacterium]
MKKIKSDNRYREALNDKYVAIPSIKIANVTCFFCVILCMALGVFLFEFFYASTKLNDNISWYSMIICLVLSGTYYGLMLHKQYFYFCFTEDHIEFNLKIGSRSKDAVKIPREEISETKRRDEGFLITLKNQDSYFISFNKIEILMGSELLKKKLELL